MTNNTPEVMMWPALQAAQRQRGQTGKNPNVGAALWRHGRLVDVVATGDGGRPHAESQLNILPGDVLAVTLEPCAHEGETPACARLVADARPSKVYVGCLDPDPRTSGHGLEIMKEAGISVQAGICEHKARHVMAGFLTRMIHQRPHVRLKLAMTRDGRSALADGRSQWITGFEARQHGHLLRAEADAIMVGAATFIQDQPTLTCRLGLSGRDPEIFVLSGREEISSLPENVQILGTSGGQQDLTQILRQLAQEGIGNLLVESGGRLAASLLQAELVDELYCYQSDLLLGANARSALGALKDQELLLPKGMIVKERRQLGQDQLTRYVVER